MSKTRKRVSSGAPSHKTLNVGKDADEQAALMAQQIIHPSVTAACTMKRLHGEDDPRIDLSALVQELSGQVKAVADRELGRAEAMLVAQVHTLDTLFNQLTQRAALNMGEYMGAAETYFKLALRSQNQCRATVETLAAIKNPQPVAFVRQANIANGPQQVNNATPATAEPSRAGESQNQQNKLLEDLPYERLDTGATGTAGRIDPPLETVGAVNGTEDGRG